MCYNLANNDYNTFINLYENIPFKDVIKYLAISKAGNWQPSKKKTNNFGF